MKNCIFLCIFNNENNLKLLYLLLDSIYIYGNLFNTDILIYTSSKFMNIIKQSHLFNDKIKFEINDQYDTVFQELKSKLNFFELSISSNYNKILYLDLNIIIKDNINKLFESVKEDILYTLEEGTLKDDCNYWCKTLFGNEISEYENKTIFTTRILLFSNCEKIKSLFKKIKDDMTNNLCDFYFFVNPYIIYHSFKDNLYDNQILKKFAIINDKNTNSDKIIHCFCEKTSTEASMKTFFDMVKKNKEIENNYSNIPPKIIYMCHKYLDQIEIYSKNWKKLNPEYDIKLYDDEMCKTFLLNEYSQLHLDIFNFLKDGPIKADFWRVCIINKYGGLYVDADIKPLVPLNKFIENDDEFVTCISFNFKKNILPLQLNPHFILSNKNNIILQNCIDSYIKLYNNKESYDYWKWSVCELLTIEGISEKKSQILYLNNQKCKFLHEIDSNNCEYNGEIVLNNRYDTYVNHNFITSQDISGKEKFITHWDNYKKDEIHSFDYRNLTTYEIPNKIIRLGQKHDGGYIIVDGLCYDLFLSCGINNDVGFEEAFLDKYKGLKCFAFDGTINKFPQHRNPMEWVNKNIGYFNTNKTTNLKEYIKDHNNIFLKMDIEGSEYNWIDAMSVDELNKISQIVLEIHWAFDKYRNSMLEKLAKTHYVIHLHGNNYSGINTDIHHEGLEKIPIPEVLEITYVRKDLFQNVAKNVVKQFPTKLDYPNNPYIPDHIFSIPQN